MPRITEVSRTYRDEPGTQAEAVAKLEAQGWQDRGGADVWGNVELFHPEAPGQRRIVARD